MNSRDRHQHILAEVHQKRHVSARDLAAAIGVSEATVRRDLRTLADAGQIELVYGGATLRRSSDYSFRSKSTRNVEAKRVIGRLAADLVHDQEQVFLDSGTTTFEMAAFLKRRHGISVIVNSARLALELDVPDLRVILLGGQYRADRMDCIGPLAMSMLDQLRGYTCFIGADGLSMDFGPAASDIESAALFHRAVQNARETILVADHSKFDSPSLFKIVEWNDVSRVVTDKQPGDAWIEFLESRGVQVVCPPAAAPVATQNAG